MHARDFTSSYYSFFHSHNHAKHIVFIYKESTYSFNLTAKVRPLYRYFFHIAFLGMSREGKRNQRLSVERICLTYISHDYFLFYGLLLAYTLILFYQKLSNLSSDKVFSSLKEGKIFTLFTPFSPGGASSSSPGFCGFLPTFPLFRKPPALRLPAHQ